MTVKNYLSCQDKYKQIIFVSELRNPHTNASSTQIMTKNLLYGFRELTDCLILVAIISSENDAEVISDYYDPLCDKIITIHDITRFRTNPLFSKLSMVHEVLVNHSSCIPLELRNLINTSTLLVSHSPSIDSALVCREIKHICPKLRYIQYWGDPLALSLITPEEYSMKRSIQRWVERRLHSYADRIAYGTKSLYDAQMELFPEIRDKAYSVEVSYNPEEKDAPDDGHKRLKIGYFGNYYSNIRNIFPFYEAACESPEADFTICGSGDIELEGKEWLEVLNRIPQSVVAEEEAKLDVVVCLLNKVGVQIPGKIFYQTNTKKTILVITDGPRKKQIVEELERSGRFVFCDNEKESIKKVLNRIVSENNSNYGNTDSDYSPKDICKGIIGLEQ